MERLTQHEIRALLTFIGECYEAWGFEDFVNHLLQALPKLIPAELVSYSEMDSEKSVSSDRTNPPEFSTPELVQRFDRHMHEHPVLQHNLRTGDGQAWRISDFRSQREFHKSGLYNEFYRMVGIEDGLCFVLPSGSPVVIGIALHRDRWGFPERTRVLGNLLRPHLTRAWQNARSFDTMQEQMRLCVEMSSSPRSGIVVLNSSGDLLFMNAQARECLAECFGSSAWEGDLPKGLLVFIRQHQPQGLTDIHEPSAPSTLGTGSRRLRVRLLSALKSQMIILDKLPASENPETLGLSAREAQVLEWLAQGKTNIEIGLILGMSPRTVQKHLEHIFDKLGVETRTAAAARFLRGN